MPKLVTLHEIFISGSGIIWWEQALLHASYASRFTIPVMKCNSIRLSETSTSHSSFHHFRIYIISHLKNKKEFEKTNWLPSSVCIKSSLQQSFFHSPSSSYIWRTWATLPPLFFPSVFSSSFLQHHCHQHPPDSQSFLQVSEHVQPSSLAALYESKDGPQRKNFPYHLDAQRQAFYQKPCTKHWTSYCKMRILSIYKMNRSCE